MRAQQREPNDGWSEEKTQRGAASFMDLIKKQLMTLTSSSALGVRLQGEGETPSMDKDSHTRCMYDNTPVGMIRL